MTFAASIIAEHGDVFSDQAKATIADIEKLLGDTRDLEDRIAKLEKRAPLESELAELRRIGAQRNGGAPHLYLVTVDKGADSVDIDEAKRLGLIKAFTPKAPPQHVDPVAALNAGVTMDRFNHGREDL